MRATAWALLGSFAVHLIPIVHGHGGTLLGALVIADLAEGWGRKEPPWIAAEVGLAGLYQILAFASLRWWLLRRGPLRAMSVAAAAIASVPLLNWAMLLALPTVFLIEEDAAPERTDLALECAIDDAELAAVDTGPGPDLARAGEAWLRVTRGLAYRRLHMPGCRVEEVPAAFLTPRTGVQRVAPGGVFLYTRHDDGAVSFWYVAGDGAQPRRLSPPPGGDHAPVLSNDGRLVGWLYRERTPARVVQATGVRLEDMAGGGTRDVRLEAPPRARLELLAVDAAGGTLLLTRGAKALVRYDFDGAPRPAPPRIDGFPRIGAGTLLTSGDGIVVWDGYRESGRYRLRWRLGDADGGLDVPKGRGITDVAVSPDGRLVALSTTTALNIGSIPDRVVVVESAGGREVYRRYQPTYTRSQVAFLGDARLAISRREDGRAWVEVLRLPQPRP